MPVYELTLHDYWRIIRKRIRLVILSFLLVIAATIFYTMGQTPVYRAHTQVEIGKRFSPANYLSEIITWYPGDMMSTEARIATSRPVIEKTIRELSLAGKNPTPEKIDEEVSHWESKVAAHQVGNSNILQIEVTCADPEKAALVANTLTQVYLEKSYEVKIQARRDMRKFIGEQMRSVRESLEAAEDALYEFEKSGNIELVRRNLSQKLADMKLNLADLKRRYTARHPRVLDLEDNIKALKSTIAALSRKELAKRRLERDLKINEGLYTMLSKKYKEALIAESDKENTKRVINPAVKPSSPISPNRKLNVVVGGTVGLIFGFVLAFLKEHLDTSIATIEDVENFLKLPVLGIIPHIAGADKNVRAREGGIAKAGYHTNRLVIFSDPKSPIAESYRTLQTNVDFARTEDVGNVLLFTSTSLQEGKSITICNFALAAAQMSKKVLLVESDFRRPVIDKMFGLGREPGLSEVLRGAAKWEDVSRGTADFILGDLESEKIIRIYGIDNLRVITSGKLPPNPTQILGSRRMKQFIEDVRKKFDIVLFDTAPVLPVADSIIMAPLVGGVVIVYQVGRTARGALRRAATQLEQAKAKLLGVVLNDIRASEMESIGYYYYYRYHERAEDGRWGKLLRRLGFGKNRS